MAAEDDLNDAGTPAFPDERQNRIAELVAMHGKVHMSQLVKLFDVTEVTLRKDLNALEQRGLLKRTHGGAVNVRPPLEQEVVTELRATPSESGNCGSLRRIGESWRSDLFGLWNDGP